MSVFVLNKTAGGQFNFSLKDAEGKTLLKSEQYESKSSANHGVESVRNNAENDARYEQKTAKNGSFYFNLKAGNGQIVGTSVMYAEESDCAAAIAKVKAEAAKAKIEDKT